MPIHDSILGYYWRFFNVSFSGEKDISFQLVSSNETLPNFQIFVLPADIPSTEHYDALIDCADARPRVTETRCEGTMFRQAEGYYTVGIRYNNTATEPVKYSLKVSVARTVSKANFSLVEVVFSFVVRFRRVSQCV